VGIIIDCIGRIGAYWESIRCDLIGGWCLCGTYKKDYNRVKHYRQLGFRVQWRRLSRPRRCHNPDRPKLKIRALIYCPISD